MREVAEHLGVSEDEVLEALSADGCFTPTSLDLAVGEQGDAVLSDTISVEDPAMDEAEARIMLMPAVRALPERERRVLYLRFFKQQTQSQIAEQIGVTQMQVSRILSRVLAQLRTELEDPVVWLGGAMARSQPHDPAAALHDVAAHRATPDLGVGPREPHPPLAAEQPRLVRGDRLGRVHRLAVGEDGVRRQAASLNATAWMCEEP